MRKVFGPPTIYIIIQEHETFHLSLGNGVNEVPLRVRALLGNACSVTIVVLNNISGTYTYLK